MVHQIESVHIVTPGSYAWNCGFTIHFADLCCEHIDPTRSREHELGLRRLGAAYQENVIWDLTANDGD